MLYVLDTLREDHSQDLSELKDEGFLRYENALAPAPWTLPTHISIFTGLLPSQHGAHERPGAQYYQLHEESRVAMSRNTTLMDLVRKEGYQSYAFCSNPLISRRFGFRFDYYCDFAKDPREEELKSFFKENKIPKNVGRMAQFIFLIKKRKLGLLTYHLYDRMIKKRVSTLLRKKPSQPDKSTRSQRFLRVMQDLKFDEPFFLFVNLMEAHEPYFRGNEKEDAFLHRQFALLTDSNYNSKKLDVRARYAKHASLSASRLIDLLHVMKPFYERSIIIVTSDHGQLLGERGRYGHGTFLDDELLRVPLYVRYPTSCEPLRQQRGSFVNLTEIPRIVKYASNQTDKNDQSGLELGSDACVSETFGMMSDCSDFAKNEDQLRKFQSSYSWKVKLHSAKGSAIFNHDSASFEEIRGELDEMEAKRIILRILNQVSSNKLGEMTSAPVIAREKEEVFTQSEIKDLEEKLSTLGYS